MHLSISVLFHLRSQKKLNAQPCQRETLNLSTVDYHKKTEVSENILAIIAIKIN